MKDEIRDHLNNPKQLEALYRSNKTSFKRAFQTLYPELKGNAMVDFWKERLDADSDEVNWGTGKELVLVIGAALVAGLIAKLPGIFGIDEEFFYSRNIGFIIFPLLTAYFAWKQRLSAGKITLIIVASLTGLIFINLLPNVKNSDTLILSGIHLLLVLWSILGFAFVGGKENTGNRRLDFLKFNGDLVVITTLILIAGGIMTGLTIGLFQLIGLNIEEFYFKNIVAFVLPSAPIIGTYLIQTNPQLVGRVSPVIAKLFSPLVIVMLLVYLGAIIYAEKNPYQNREFLLIFNALLVGVMAIIFFSVAESTKTAKSSAGIWILLILSLITIVVNGVALSAILFRISEWGITPNRTAVLGGNVLILVNLLLVTVQLYRVLCQKSAVGNVGKAITSYLPIYLIWAIIVTFLFPLFFWFK